MVFEGPPKTEQTLWPRHCVQESWGAELHKDLKVKRSSLEVKVSSYMKTGSPKWSGDSQRGEPQHRLLLRVL